MQKDVQPLRDLIVELEKITVYILSAHGDSSDPKNYFFSEVTINGKPPLLHQSYLLTLWQNVKESKVVLSYPPAKRERLKTLLTTIKGNFTTFANPAYDPQFWVDSYCTTRSDLEIEFSKDTEWLFQYNRSDEVIVALTALLSHQFKTMLEIVEGLIRETDIKVPINRKNSYFSYHYSGWNRNADPLRDMQSVLEKNNRIEKLNWQYFSQSFSPETKKFVSHRIIWLGNVSEFKLFIDTLFATGKFSPGNKKWDVAERCFILQMRKEFDWSTMRLQKHPKYQPAYIQEIAALFC